MYSVYSTFLQCRTFLSQTQSPHCVWYASSSGGMKDNVSLEHLLFEFDTGECQGKSWEC